MSRVLTSNTVNKIRRNGQLTGVLYTPKGNCRIYTLVESRGSSTGFAPKEFEYVELPNGMMASLTKGLIDKWEKNNWELKRF